MDYIFEVSDKSGRKVHLSKERWSHIRKKHPEVDDFELIKETLLKADKSITNLWDSTVYYFYKFFKNRKSPKRYLCVAIKFLNGEGYVITAYFDKKM